MTKHSPSPQGDDSASHGSSSRTAKEIREDLEIAAQRSCVIANRAEWRVQLYEFISRAGEIKCQ